MARTINDARARKSKLSGMLGFKEPEILIAILGVTGAGKTTFVSRVPGDTTLEISHDIDSCTQQVTPTTFTLDNTRVCLLDTPGFDDSHRPELQIIRLLVQYLATTYLKGARLSGVIFIQPFNEERVRSSEKTRLRLFKKLLGEDAYGRVVIACTKWNNAEEAKRLQAQRVEREDIWGELVAHGAKVVLHEDTKESAEAIVRGIMALGGSVDLLIQKELVANGGKLEKTSAGKQVDEDIGAEVTKLTDEIEALKKEGEAAAEEIKELEEKVVVCHDDMEDLKRMC